MPMDETPREPPKSSDFLRAMTNLTRSGLELWAAQAGQVFARADDPLRLRQAGLAFARSLLEDPLLLARTQAGMLCDYVRFGAQWLDAGEGANDIAPAPGDRRFRDTAWADNPIYRGLLAHHLIVERAVDDLVRKAPGLDADTRQRLQFAAQQFVDALSPSNFALTNPQVVQRTLDTGGRNLLDGIDNLLADLRAGNGQLDVRMTEPEAFKVGKDLAVTPGQVVFENELMQLIQYEAETDKVYRRPLLLVPPWMNKYYILDLRPGNSFIEWLVAQGHTVFVISWVNPDRSLAHKGFAEYMLEGPIAAMSAIERATGESQVNVVGYCLGGILIAAALAYLTARGDQRVKSATLLTTMVDFREAGEVCMFINEEALAELEKRIEAQGFLDGNAVYNTFRALRANDLIWSFFINNYLLGNSPGAFDLLFWNADSTNMPAAMHTFFMRNMYLNNLLREPGGITLAGVPIDVTTVTTPTYILSTMEDHIAPWRTTYHTTQLFRGPVKFVLGESGHIAGVINPPHREKYGYWVNHCDAAQPDQWLRTATRQDGSWWPDWMRWMRRHLGAKVAARTPGDGQLAVIEPAPGRYVQAKLTNDANI